MLVTRRFLALFRGRRDRARAPLRTTHVARVVVVVVVARRPRIPTRTSRSRRRRKSAREPAGDRAGRRPSSRVATFFAVDRRSRER
jgi:hypothetical protein